MEIREARQDEYADAIELILREQPHLERNEVEPLLLDDGMVPERLVLVAQDAGRLIGVGYWLHSGFQPVERAGVRIVVVGAARGGGVGRDLMARLLAEVPQRFTSLRTFTHDDDPTSVAVAEHWGFLRLQRSITSRVDLADVVPPTLPEHATIESSPTFEFADHDAVEAMLDASQTNPERAHSGAMNLARLRAMLADGEQPLLVVVRVDGAPAGICLGSVVDGLSYVGYTGVDPGFRGRGLARLLKETVHHQALLAGASVCYAENEEHNAGIRRLNAELGYEVLFGVWRHELRR